MRWFGSTPPPLLVDLFSGYGGLSDVCVETVYNLSMTDLLVDGKLGDGSWSNAPESKVRLFAFVHPELGWAWQAYDIKHHKWVTEPQRAGTELEARTLGEEWVRALVHDRQYGAAFTWHRATDEIILTCERCRKTMRIRWDRWYDWKAANPHSIQLCRRPKDGVSVRSGECGGGLMESLPDGLSSQLR